MEENGLQSNHVLESALPAFTLTVDGKAYPLRYDFLTFRNYEKKTGVNPVTQEFGVSVSNLDAFLWAGAQRMTPGLTLEEVQGWITPKNIEALIDYVGECFMASLPPPKAASAEGAPDPPKA